MREHGSCVEGTFPCGRVVPANSRTIHSETRDAHPERYENVNAHVLL